MSTGRNNSGTFPLLLSLLPNPLLISRKLRSILIQTIRTSRTVATDTHSTVFDISEEGNLHSLSKYRYSTLIKEHSRCSILNCFFGLTSYATENSLSIYKEQSRLKIILEWNVFIKQIILLPRLKRR